MKQLNLFEECIPDCHGVKEKNKVWKLFVDGASRRNPGDAGAGIYLLKHEKQVYKKGFFLGRKTNNQAEYLALLLGIFYAKKHLADSDTLYIFSDSELLIKHMKREYAIRNLELKQLFNVAFALLDGVQYALCHILRESNTVADAMANEGIDRKIRLPEEFVRYLQTHDIIP